MAGRTGFLAFLLLGLVALSSAQEQVDSIADGINAFIESIEDGSQTRDLAGWKHHYKPKPTCTHCGVTASRPPSPPPAYPPPSPPPVVLCPPPPSPCAVCHRPASPPPKVSTPVLCPPPPVRVSTPSPCKWCHKPVPSPVRVPTPSPCKWCHKPVPSPVRVPIPSPIVKVPSPPRRGPWCGKTTKWVKKTWGRRRGRKFQWVAVKVDIYCKVGEKCCKIPKSWGKKTWGPKRRFKGTSTQLRCYKSCPNCWIY